MSIQKRTRLVLTNLLVTVLSVAVIAVGQASGTLAVKPKCKVTDGGSTTACGLMCIDWKAGGGGTFEANCQDCCNQMGTPTTACYAACSGSTNPTPCVCPP